MSIEVEYDHELVKALSDETFKEDIPAGTLGERDASLIMGHLSHYILLISIIEIIK